ncbi:MAG: MBL fold metallo-hydrolase [archaeon]
MLEDGDTSVFLDFGKSFGKEKQYYEQSFLSPRKETHLLNLGLLPRMDGLYKDDLEPPVDGVLISHPHTDHWGYSCYLDNRVPLYCGEATRDIITCYEFSSSMGPSKDYYLANLTKSRGEEVFKDFRTYRTGNNIEIGSIEVEPVHVDHSIPAAYGFIIHTSSGPIIYTGDLRFHGPRGDMTYEFVKKASAAEPVSLVTEGTNITGASISSEASVEEDIAMIASKHKGLVAASFSDRDVDRIRSMYNAAKKTGRRLAVSMKQAFMLQALASDPHLEIFDSTDPDVLVFQREKSRTYAWEERVLDRWRICCAEEVNKIQSDIILAASYYDMNELCDIVPEPGSVFILSQSEPFDEEGEIQHDKLLNWCNHYGMPQYHVHSSGHAAPHELKALIKTIDPETVYPVHTERPGLLKHYINDLDCNVVLPIERKTVEI